jgi:DNA-binding NarL/FixJ family response regulator
MRAEITGDSSSALIPLRVLIADDSAVMREGLVRTLNRIGWIRLIGEVATVQQAIAATLLAAPDVVILDMHMPGGSGLDVLKRVKDQPRPPAVIAFTLSPEWKEGCEAAGADFFLDKSAGAEPLISALQTIRFAKVKTRRMHTGKTHFHRE